MSATYERRIIQPTVITYNPRTNLRGIRIKTK